jgi:hypothetical protein
VQDDDVAGAEQHTEIVGVRRERVGSRRCARSSGRLRRGRRYACSTRPDVRPSCSALAMICAPEVMMRFAARTRTARRGDLGFAGAGMVSGVGHCAPCQLGPI